MEKDLLLPDSMTMIPLPLAEEVLEEEAEALAEEAEALAEAEPQVAFKIYEE